MKIQAGDTLSKIAKREGVTVDELLKSNPEIKNKNLIVSGRELKMPSSFRGGGNRGGPDLAGGGATSRTSATSGTAADSGDKAAIKAELKKGFEAAGRPDLAAAVDTPAFDAWINKESSWKTGAVSPANNQGKANGGLFQVWHGHGVNAENMSPFDQAKLIADKFPQLTPAKIEKYGQEISSGSYKGWG